MIEYGRKLHSKPMKTVCTTTDEYSEGAAPLTRSAAL